LSSRPQPENIGRDVLGLLATACGVHSDIESSLQDVNVSETVDFMTPSGSGQCSPTGELAANVVICWENDDLTEKNEVSAVAKRGRGRMWRENGRLSW
jgi:hypothetical protein